MHRRLTVLCALVLGSTAILPGAEKAKQTQGAVTLRALPKSNAASRSPEPKGYSYGTAAWEVLAIDVPIASRTCVDFDSTLDLMGTDVVAITILALNVDIRQTRVIPFFGVSGAPYMAASSKIIEGDSFYPYIDTATGIIPVTGNQMMIRLCNDDGSDVRYTQLTAYVSHR